MKRLGAAWFATLAAVGSVALSSNGHAQVITGKQLAALCNAQVSDWSNPADDWQQGTCVGFLYGFTAGQELVRTAQSDAKHPDEFHPLYCAPSSTSVGDYETVFKAFAIAHPDRLSMSAENAVFAALVGAFPCPWEIAVAKGEATQK